MPNTRQKVNYWEISCEYTVTSPISPSRSWHQCHNIKTLKLTQCKYIELQVQTVKNVQNIVFDYRSHSQAYAISYYTFTIYWQVN